MNRSPSWNLPRFQVEWTYPRRVEIHINLWPYWDFCLCLWSFWVFGWFGHSRDCDCPECIHS